jgi:hypothetical protein
MFPKLPTELRHKIYRGAFPARILELGVDFPYPKFTRLENICDSPGYKYTTKCSAYPTPTYLPALFHTCRESRTLCLEAYIPFAYNYAHPSLDTLYISPDAGKEWFTVAKSEGVSAPLYPLALLDRIAVHFDPLDVGALCNGAGRGFPLYDALRLMGYYGVPKELLLVGGTDCLNEDGDWSSRQGFEIVDSVVDLVQPALAPQKPLNAAAIVYVETVAKGMMEQHYHASVPWWRLRIPTVRVVCAVRQRKFLRKCDESEGEIGMRLLKAGERLATAWSADIRATNERRWNCNVDGNLYYPDNMNKQMARHGKERFMLDQGTLEKLGPFTSESWDFGWPIDSLP